MVGKAAAASEAAGIMARYSCALCGPASLRDHRKGSPANVFGRSPRKGGRARQQLGDGGSVPSVAGTERTHAERWRGGRRGVPWRLGLTPPICIGFVRDSSYR